ncbi:phthiocerol/phthiodiolone dimycocerosyl transferase family protein [Nocardia aurantia]|uniref:Phthiocerol/phthiodiolone dimycocerosyl transferase n=1 Tax=Nocardia aurantia TaxID=2585199 RepID=A0A7K0DUR3_9NOCA|nr:hypothetical protein [Nocardia aurantia]MQY29510.1 Phthiocerol/phthiodiolone dimycocerosyl transferase [Nocardia aurantia]
MSTVAAQHGSKIRQLAPSEEMFVGFGEYIGLSLRTVGTLDTDTLADAFDALLDSHPVLTACLSWDGHGHNLVAPAPGPRLAASVRDGRLDEPLAGADPDPENALAGLYVVRDGRRAVVTLLVHHCIADALSASAMLAQMWSYYTDLTENRTFMVVPHEFPASAEELLSGRPPERRTGSAPRAPEPVAAGSVPNILSLRLTAAETEHLVEIAKRELVTVNSLVTAAIVRAEADCLGLSPDGIRFHYPMNMRAVTRPPTPVTAGTAVLGIGRFRPPAGVTDQVDIARAFADNLRAELVDGTVRDSALRLPEAFGAISGHGPGAVLTTNWQTIVPPPVPDGLEFEDFHATIYHRPRRPGTVGLAETPGTTLYFVNIFQGRLRVQISAPQSVAVEPRQRRLTALRSYLAGVGVA